MKSNYTKIKWKRIKLIPKRNVVVWLLLFVICMYFTIKLFYPIYHELENLQERQIQIDDVRIIDTRNKIGSRMKLEIVSDDETFYVWYPVTFLKSYYKEYSYLLKKDLLSGNVTCVTAKIAKNKSIHDNLFNRNRIVDLRCEDTVYYDIETEKVDLKYDYISLWVVTILSLIVMLVYSGYLIWIYVL